MRFLKLRRFQHEHGFTLVEVLVVVAIVGILAATTIPTYLKTRPQRMLASTTNLLVANFNSARVLAIQNNQNVYMEFLPEVDTFRIWDSVGWQRYLNYSVHPAAYSVTSFSIAPVKTFSPLMNIQIYSGVPSISRNLSSGRAIAGDKVVSLDVDIRMDPNPCADQDLTQPPIIARPPGEDRRMDPMRNLSRVPLLYIVFHPDGSVANSWSYPCTSVGEDIYNHKPPPVGRSLGVTELFLQVRGDMNPLLANNYKGDFEILPAEGIFPNQSLTTMYYEDGTPRVLGGFQGAERKIEFAAMSDSNGRRIVINNATGRVVVENWAPYNIDIPPREGEAYSNDDASYPQRKHWN